MAMQTQMSSLAKKLGARLSQANAQCAGKPLAIAGQNLPGGINNGIARLVMMVWKEQEKDGGKVPKGQMYFLGRAVVMYPQEHAGVITDCLATTIFIPLCDVAARKLPNDDSAKASTLTENWDKFRSIIEMFGIAPCKETDKTDPLGVKTEAYFIAAMQALTNDPKKPRYVKFITKDIIRKVTPQNPKPSVFVYEQWVGVASQEDLDRLLGKFDPASGIKEVSANGTHTQPDANDAPPDVGADGLPNLRPGNTLDYSNAQALIHSMSPDTSSEESTEPESEDELIARIAALVEIAGDDTNDQYEAARSELEDMAWANGWTKNQTEAATSWEELGDMAQLTPDESQDGSESESNRDVTVGSKWKYSKRDKQGAKITNSKGEEFPPHDVEVTSVDLTASTCSLKYVKDGKDIIDIRTKKPLPIKFEWLE